MNAQKGTLLGLAIITAALAILVGGYAVIWHSEHFWRYPPLESLSSFQEAKEIFGAYVSEKTEIDERFAWRRKRNVEHRQKAMTSKDVNEVFAIWAERSFMLAAEPNARNRPLEDIRQAALIGLDVESFNNLPKEYDAESKAIVEKYRALLSTKSTAEQTAQVNQRAWLASLGASLIILCVCIAITWLGLRILRQSAMPGTVFDSAARK